MPRTAVWGPKGLGGLELNTNMYNLQAQCALTYLVRTLRWNQTVAKDIIAALNALQLLSGFGTPLLEKTSPSISYAGKGWLINLREMMAMYEASAWVEDAWIPAKQRQYDQAIQEEFAGEDIITPLEKRLANEFRLWLRVTHISELADIAGKDVPIERIRNGSEWRATPVDGYEWPNTIEPTDKHRAAFRRCLRLTFCPHADPLTRVKNYPLYQPLGKWYPVPRMIEFPAYRSLNAVYYRDEIGLHKCTERSGGFFDVPLECVRQPPLKSNPIEPNMSGPTTLWTRKSRVLIRPYVAQKQRIITRDDLPSGTIEHIDLVSDAAVYPSQGKGAVTWHAVTKDNRRRSMDIPIEVQYNSYSYRHELIGVYEGLYDMTVRPGQIKRIDCHCDNKAGIDKIKLPVLNPGAMAAADMDVVLAIKQLVEENPDMAIHFKHVKGHANEKKPRHQCSRIEQINIDCDEEAGMRVESGDPPTPYSPLPGAKCMIKVRGSWISQRVDKAIQQIPSAAAQEKFLMKKLRIDEVAIRDIDQETIAAARSGHGWARFARTSKMMNHWLPVGHNWRHHGAENDRCPGCGAPDETFTHLFTCPNEDLRATCREGLQQIEKVARQLKLPDQIVWLLLLVIRQECGLEGYAEPQEPTLRKIWDAQQHIGFSNFMIGWVSREWQKGLKRFGSKDPGGQASQMLTLLWDCVCEPIWECRNNIMANKPNPSALREMTALREKLTWYRRHQVEVLPERFRFLVTYQVCDLKKWDRERCRAALRLLEKAAKIYEIECRQRVRGQRVMTDFLTSSEN
jgi:hypothetical protein